MSLRIMLRFDWIIRVSHLVEIVCSYTNACEVEDVFEDWGSAIRNWRLAVRNWLGLDFVEIDFSS